MKEGTAEYTLRIQRVRIRDGGNVTERFQVTDGSRTRNYDGQDVTDPYENPVETNGTMQRFYEANRRELLRNPQIMKLEVKVTEALPVPEGIPEETE